MIPALAAIFAGGAVCSLALARIVNRRWVWAVAFLEVLFLFHEFSFVLLPPAEWFRMDLLLTLPLFTAGNLLLAGYGLLRCRGWWVTGLAVVTVATPVWFFGIR